jgi:hypothetical protein
LVLELNVNAGDVDSGTAVLVSIEMNFLLGSVGCATAVDGVCGVNIASGDFGKVVDAHGIGDVIGMASTCGNEFA